jgi:hypothetical protein
VFNQEETANEENRVIDKALANLAGMNGVEKGQAYLAFD